jgi:hypothetical protein
LAVPLAAIDGAVSVDLLTHARKESTRRTRCACVGHPLRAIIDLESDFVKLGNGIATDFARRAIMICDTFGAFLQAATNDGSLVINFADDQHRADYTRRQTLQHDSLIIIYWDL